MVDNEVIAGSSRGSQERRSDETLVSNPQTGPLPTKQGEIGWVPPEEGAAADQAPRTSVDQLPPVHPADRSTPVPSPPLAIAPNHPNDSTPSFQSRSSAIKRFLRTPRPLPKIHGVRPATVLRLTFITFMLISSIIGWVVAANRMNHWAEQDSAPASSDPNDDSNGDPGQMTQSSLLFVHVAFGGAVIFQLFILERSVYRFRAERYAFLHPEEMANSASNITPAMSLAPWNRPPLPTYAAALGVRGTGDVEDNIIAGPPPPEYGNTRGSTLLLSSHLPSNLNTSQSRPISQHTARDALGRPVEAWSRPVSYGQAEMMENARRSLDLETALARLEGTGTNENVTRPEAAVVRR